MGASRCRLRPVNIVGDILDLLPADAMSYIPIARVHVDAARGNAAVGPPRLAFHELKIFDCFGLTLGHYRFNLVHIG